MEKNLFGGFSIPEVLKVTMYAFLKVLSNIYTENILPFNKTASGVLLKDSSLKKTFRNEVQNVRKQLTK